MAQRFDVLVLGSGPAGGVAAKACNNAGLTVAVAERDGFGGTCPLRGCEPKKTLVEAAAAVDAVGRLQGKGVAGKAFVDWAELMRFKRSFTEPVSASVQKAYQQWGVTALHGECVFKGENRLELQHETAPPEQVEAERILIAVGAVPRPLDIPGAELLHESSHFLDLDELPRRIIFLGGGYVSFELAMVAATAGAEVSLATRGDRFLRGFDKQLVDNLLAACEERGIALYKNAPPHHVEQGAAGLVLHAGDEGEKRLEVDMVVNGAGRVPATMNLSLEAAGVDTQKGAVLVNDEMRSVSNKAVFAAGDCVARGMPLTPVAALQAEVAAQNILHDLGKGGGPMNCDLSGAPTALFTDPPLARVGMLESEAKEQGLDYESFAGDASDWSEYQRLGRQHAGYRILVQRSDGRLLGAHFLGEGAEELASLIGLAIRQGLSVDALRNAIWAYPSHAYTLRYMLG